MSSSTGTVVFNDSRIKATGVIATESIGVGTANPTSNLHVVGDASIQSNLEVGTANLFVDTTTGNVGVGTTNPGFSLHVHGTANVGALTTTGNIGVGTTNPGFSLDVRGTANVGALATTGNVGVGTTNPGFSLDVHGTANVGALTMTSVSIKDDPHSELNFNFINSKWLQQAKLTAGDASASDYFGYSASISSDGSTAIVGAYQGNDNEQTNSGCAYIFVRSGSSWTQQAKLTAGVDVGSADFLGESVSISGDGSTAIVGARLDDDNGQSNSGSAYIFVRSGGTWTQQQKLTAGTDAGANDWFGTSVFISGDGNTAIVGAFKDDDNGQTDSGSAYIFVRSGGTWTQQAKLTAGDAGASDHFGYSVSISGDGSTAIVGSRLDDVNGQSNSGSAYIFVRSGGTWTQQVKFTTGADAVAYDQFGESVSISGDGSTAIVGATYKDDVNGRYDSGSAYIFVRSGSSWAQQAKLTAGDAGAYDHFGYSVSISSDGNTAIVGARYDDDNGQVNSGSAYIFVRSGGTWTQQAKFTADADAGASDYFGWSVSISGNGGTAIMGAYLDDDNGQSDSGSAYIFNAERAVHISKHIDVDGSAYIEKDVIMNEFDSLPALTTHGTLGREDLYTWEGSTNTIVNTLNQQNEPFYYNSDSSFKRVQTVGSASFDSYYYTNKWNYTYMIDCRNMNQDSQGSITTPTSYVLLSLPVAWLNGKTSSHALFLKFISRDRWSSMCAYVTNSSKTSFYRLQGNVNTLKDGGETHSRNLWYGPDGGMAYAQSYHEWLMYSIPEYVVEEYSYSETRDGKSKYNRNINIALIGAYGNQDGGRVYWSGMAMRTNPYGLTYHNALCAHWYINGGSGIGFYANNWADLGILGQINEGTNYTNILIPICPPKDPDVHGYPDFYLGYIGHNSPFHFEKRGRFYLQHSNGTYKYIGRPSHIYGGRFGKDILGMLNDGRCAPNNGLYVSIPSSDYVVKVGGRPHLRIRIDNSNTNGWTGHMHPLGFYTEVVYRDGSKDGLGDNGQQYI